MIQKQFDEHVGCFRNTKIFEIQRNSIKLSFKNSYFIKLNAKVQYTGD